MIVQIELLLFGVSDQLGAFVGQAQRLADKPQPPGLPGPVAVQALHFQGAPDVARLQIHIKQASGGAGDAPQRPPFGQGPQARLKAKVLLPRPVLPVSQWDAPSLKYGSPQVGQVGGRRGDVGEVHGAVVEGARPTPAHKFATPPC